MADLKTDSPLSRRIVRAFLDFLDSVEPAPGVDVEGLEVSRECLAAAFKLNLNSVDDPVEPGLLVNLFRSLDSSDGSRTDASQSTAQQDEDWRRQPGGTGVSNDELFGQFFAALEKHHFFKATPDGKDDAIQLDKATRLFHDALNEMEKSGCQSYNSDTLAESLKSQGNRALQSKRYYDAVELYTCAIALSESKAIYYCNRAAAYTQVQKYAEAIKDCLKSIEIDPNYSKAYSRLGLVYYAQGNYRDAIDKGFKKALQLDPRNESIIENIQVAEKKLKEEQPWTQTSSSTSSGIPPFGSMPMPFDPSSLPANFANMMRNAVNPDQRQGGEASNHPPYQQQQPGVGGANINVNVEEMMPDELRGVLGSVMGMFTGATPPPPATTGGGNNGEQPSNGRSPAP